MITIGDTFLIGNDKNPIKHLYIIISSPNENNEVLTVNMTKRRGITGEDTSCLLKKGMHPFITQDTLINYHEAFCVSIEDLNNKITSKKIISQKSVSEPVLKMIQDGTKLTGRLPRKFNKFFKYFSTEK